jgi:chromosome partitioning protein
MKTILITNRKGGVGKTTTSVNLAAWLGLMSKTILIIDLDTQSHVQYGFGYTEPFKNGIHSALNKKDDLNSIVHETKCKNVFFIPADINFDINKIRQDDRQLARLVRKSRFDNLFDICIIDTPPTSDILLSNALAVSDVAIVPLKAEFLGAIGVNQFLKIFYATASKINPKLELLGILPTMFNRSMKEHKLLVNHVEQKVGKQRVLSPIRNDIKLSIAFLEGSPISYLDKRCRGSRDYKELALNVLRNLKNNEEKRWQKK